MKKLSVNSINTILVEKPSYGIKGCSHIPFVLVLNNNKGTTVVFQFKDTQNTVSVGGHVFGQKIYVESIFDVEFSNTKHIIALVIRGQDADGNLTDRSYYTIGEKGSQDEYVTAFFAYEDEDGKAVYCVNIIEEQDNKPIFTTNFRYGKNNEKLLKTQLQMYLALSGVNAAIRSKIVSRGGFLPPSFNTENGGVYSEY